MLALERPLLHSSHPYLTVKCHGNVPWTSYTASSLRCSIFGSVLLMRKAWPALCFPPEPLHFCLFAKSQLRAWVSTLGVTTLREAEQTGAPQAPRSPIPTAQALLQHASCSASWHSSPGLQVLHSGLISVLCSHTSTSHCGGVLTKAFLLLWDFPFPCCPLFVWLLVCVWSFFFFKKKI